MKRSEFLTPLSWEHHSALLNANRLKLGLQNGTEVAILQEFWEYVWKTDLQPHFDREERLLAQNAHWTKLDGALANQMIAEHRAMEAHMRALANAQKEDERKKILAELSKMVSDHVRFEEGKLFPAIEQVFPPADLQEIGKRLKEEHVTGCITWQPAFWKRPK
jgi:hemerythrin-like domain-containing protein